MLPHLRNNSMSHLGISTVHLYGEQRIASPQDPNACTNQHGKWLKKETHNLSLSVLSWSKEWKNRIKYFGVAPKVHPMPVRLRKTESRVVWPLSPISIAGKPPYREFWPEYNSVCFHNLTRTIPHKQQIVHRGGHDSRTPFEKNR